MKLIIISHTEHYMTNDGVLVGWGPTVNEINHLIEHFEEIIHLAMLYPVQAPASSLPYESDRIKFVSLPAVGGKSLVAKANIIWNTPKVLRLIHHYLKQADYFQFRAPTGIGVFVIPYLIFFTKKKGWFKYAGNWNQKHTPFGYFLQRWMLKHQSRKVTINGEWPNQPRQCITFENPCLTTEDILEGKESLKMKKWNGKLSFCFVGRLEREKGVDYILDAFSQLTTDLKSKVDKVHMIGDGVDLSLFKEKAEKSKISFVFHGFLPRTAVFDLYKNSHFLLLPTTASEGFPKVIAEALNFGCLPIVSNISSIDQYILDGINGLLLNTVSVEELKTILIKVLTKEVIDMGGNVTQIEKFSYNHYNKRILNDILR